MAATGVAHALTAKVDTGETGAVVLPLRSSGTMQRLLAVVLDMVGLGGMGVPYTKSGGGGD